MPLNRSDKRFDNLTRRLQLENYTRRKEEREFETRCKEAEAEKEVTDSIKIVSIDFQAKANALKHHCEKYELIEQQKNVSIIRRGGAYSIVVTFDREVDLMDEVLFKLVLSFGSFPFIPSGTKAAMTSSGKVMFDKSHKDWDIRVAEKESTTVTFEIQVPTDAPVGVWNTEAEATDRNDSSKRHRMCSEHLTYVLFNPWNKNDATYLPEEDDREEYVLNDTGKVRYKNYSGVMVDKGKGNDGDGTDPSHWSGSIDILETYMDKTGEPVKYGQSWVFAGVVNTVCRALGLPSRVVTNFNSAHAKKPSLTIDVYLDKKGEKYCADCSGTVLVPRGEGDFISNFHVWNDAWMARSDLPEGFGGWQVIDGTYRVGPVSLEAIRRGHVVSKYSLLDKKSFEVIFVVSEVNADVVYWYEDGDEQDGFKKIVSNTTHIGRQLLTKAKGYVEDGCYVETDK